MLDSLLSYKCLMVAHDYDVSICFHYLLSSDDIVLYFNLFEFHPIEMKFGTGFDAKKQTFLR